MTRPDILLLVFRPEDPLGGTLRHILESSADAGRKACRAFMRVCGFASAGEGLAAAVAACPNPAAILLVLPRASGRRAREWVRAVTRKAPAAPVVVVAEEAEPAEMFALLEDGAADFMLPPLRASDVLPRVWRLLERARPDGALKRVLREKFGLRQLVGESTAFLSEVSKIPRVAGCDARILISGETGTGKELCARAIHYLSPRSGGPFIPVNCGAIPPDLIENELFGHEKGAFTGATATQRGLVHEAEGGTLLLDEIDCLPPLAQVKLLRFLQEKEYRPLGSARIRRADVRVIAATNADLEAAVEEGRMRRDFYYRLNIISLTLPPLRERRADIDLLARHFLSKYAAEFNSPATDFAPEAIEKLRNADWPGNVRELEHVVERALAVATGETIRGDDINLRPAARPAARDLSFQEAKAEVVARFEREYIETMLIAHHGNITRAAESAGKDRRTFWQLIHKHRIDARQYK